MTTRCFRGPLFCGFFSFVLLANGATTGLILRPEAPAQNCLLGILTYLDRESGLVLESDSFRDLAGREVSPEKMEAALQVLQVPGHVSRTPSVLEIEKIAETTDFSILAFPPQGEGSKAAATGAEMVYALVRHGAGDKPFLVDIYPALGVEFSDAGFAAWLQQKNPLWAYAVDRKKAEKVSSPVALVAPPRADDLPSPTPEPASEKPRREDFLTDKSGQIVVPKLNRVVGVPRQFSSIEILVPVENRGKETVHFNGSKGSCSCFKDLTGPSELAPGQSAILKVRVDPTRFLSRDKFESQVLVFFEEEWASTVPINLSVEFDNRRIYVTDPQRLYFNFGSDGSEAKKTVRIYEKTKEPRKSEIVKWVGSQPTLKAELSPDAVKRDIGDFSFIGELTVTLDPKRIDPEDATPRLLITVRGEKDTTLGLEVVFNLNGARAASSSAKKD